MAKSSEEKFPIVVSESGLHICVDDILTPVKALELIKEIKKSLLDHKKLTGKHIDQKISPTGG